MSPAPSAPCCQPTATPAQCSHALQMHPRCARGSKHSIRFGVHIQGTGLSLLELHLIPQLPYLGLRKTLVPPKMNSIVIPSALQCFPLPPCPPASSPPIPTPEAACAASWEGAELSPCPARRWWVLSGVHRTHPRVQEARRCSLVAATPVWHGMHKDSLPGAEHNRALNPIHRTLSPWASSASQSLGTLDKSSKRRGCSLVSLQGSKARSGALGRSPLLRPQHAPGCLPGPAARQ